MEVINTGRKFILELEYKELVHGFALTRKEQLLLDASQIEVSQVEVVVRRKGKGRGTAEHYANAMVTDLREVC